MNPFILAGLVFTGIGLVQEAIFADEESKKKSPKPKAIAAPVSNVVAPVVIPVAPVQKKAKKEKPIIEAPSDG